MKDFEQYKRTVWALARVVQRQGGEPNERAVLECGRGLAVRARGPVGQRVLAKALREAGATPAEVDAAAVLVARWADQLRTPWRSCELEYRLKLAHVHFRRWNKLGHWELPARMDDMRPDEVMRDLKLRRATVVELRELMERLRAEGLVLPTRYHRDWYKVVYRSRSVPDPERYWAGRMGRLYGSLSDEAKRDIWWADWRRTRALVESK